MTNFSASQYIYENYSIEAPPGRHSECPECGRKKLSVTKDDRLAKCFHGSCGFIIHQAMVKKAVPWQRFMWDFMTVCHKALLRPDSDAMKWLVQQRKLDRDVCQSCEVLGEVPDGLDWAALALPCLNTLAGKERETFDDDLKKLQDTVKSMYGGLVFGHTDSQHQLLSFKFRSLREKRFTAFKTNRNTGVFNPCQFETQDLQEYSCILLVEGEFNALSILSTSKLVNDPFVRVIALGSASTADFETLQHFKEKQWVLFQDNDSAGSELAKKLQRQRSLRVAKSPFLGDDLEDLINRHITPEDAWEAVRQAISESTALYRPLELIKAEIITLRDRGGKTHQINRAVADKVLAELQDRGKLYKASQTAYYFDNANYTLIKADSKSEGLIQALYSLGLNGADKLTDYVAKEVQQRALPEGLSAEVHTLSYYQKTSNTLYLHNTDREVFKITPRGVQSVVNGTDRILFEPCREWTPFERSESVETEENLLQTLLIETVNFEENTLLLSDSKLLLKAWAYHLFFGVLHPTKPILTFIGPKNSGKTSAARRFGKLFMGRKFEVASFPESERDFIVSLTNRYIASFDNVDGHINPKLQDLLATAATGGGSTQRTLHTNNGLSEFQFNAALMITSRTAKFSRDDLSQRLLPLELKTLTGSNQSEQYMTEQILSQRDHFMSWLLKRLQKALQALEASPNMDFAVQSRMDFAVFITRLQRGGLAGFENAEDVFGRLDQSQTELTIETEPLMPLLIALAETQANILFSANELSRQLKDIATAQGTSFNVPDAAQLGRWLNQLTTEINTVVRMDVSNVRSNGKRYRFAPIGPKNQIF